MKINASKHKIFITEYVCTIDMYEDISGDIDKIIEKLSRLKRDNKEKYHKLEIDIEQDYDGVTFKLMGERIESPEEFVRRQREIYLSSKRYKISKEKQKENKKKKELKTLERLKKKYENHPLNH
jgi:hypothetical protein